MVKILYASLVTALLLTACAAQGTTTVSQVVSQPEPTEFVLPVLPTATPKVVVKLDSVKETPTAKAETVVTEDKESSDLPLLAAHMIKNDLSEAKANRYAKYIMKSSEEYAIDPFLILSIIHVETGSTFKYANKPNSHGAIGLMQILKGNAGWMGVKVSQLYDPETNIMLGTKYLKYLQDRFGHDLGITAYNQGEGNVSRGTYRTWYFDKVHNVFKDIDGNDYASKSSPHN